MTAEECLREIHRIADDGGIPFELGNEIHVMADGVEAAIRDLNDTVLRLQRRINDLEKRSPEMPRNMQGTTDISSLRPAPVPTTLAPGIVTKVR